MSRLVARAEKMILAEPGRVRVFVADYRYGRPYILPPEHFSDYHVEQGGQGSGTVFGYQLQAGGRQRSYLMRVEEPDPGGPIVERDMHSSFVTTWMLAPFEGEADRTLVALESSWEGAGGIGGFFERVFAPRALRQIQAEVLRRLRAALEDGVA